MVFLLSLAVAAGLMALLRRPLKRRPVPFYVVAALICLVLAMVDTTGLPTWVELYVLDLFRRGTLGTAFFVIVMYMAVLKNGSKLMRALMPIRGELSILASILCLCHNVFFGRTYFVAMFTDAVRMPVNQLAAGVLSILMLCIMLPLFVLSFPSVRHKFAGKTWKKIQRLAYGYYGMLYIHVVVLMLPLTLRGMTQYALSLTVYSVVFGAYGVLRLQKAKISGKIKRPGQAVCLLLALGVTVAAWAGAVQVKRLTEGETDPDPDPNQMTAYQDGTYTGTGVGYGGKIVVEVDIVDGAIAAIRLIDQKEDKSYLENAIQIVDDILAAQSVEVDTVTGATLSSDGIITAVRRALLQAKGE